MVRCTKTMKIGYKSVQTKAHTLNTKFLGEGTG